MWKIFDELSAFVWTLRLFGWTDFAGFVSFAWRTIPRRFSRKEPDFYHFDCDVKRLKFEELLFDDLKTTSWLWDFSRFRAESSFRQEKKEKYKTLSDNPKEEKTRFGLSRECLHGKNFDFCFRCFDSDRKRKGIKLSTDFTHLRAENAVRKREKAICERIYI